MIARRGSLRRLRAKNNNVCDTCSLPVSRQVTICYPFVNESGTSSIFKRVNLEPAASIAAAPNSLSTDVSQDAITLKWTGPTANVNGTTPLNLMGYNVYRTESATQAGRLLNKTPVSGTDYADAFFDFGKKYTYFVRSVSSGAEGEPVKVPNRISRRSRLLTRLSHRLRGR